MSEPPNKAKGRPAVPGGEREQRLAEALRANLHRRKAQARARAEGAESLAGGASEGTAGTGNDGNHDS